jgi:LppP/LprE lipoprotein
VRGNLRSRGALLAAIGIAAAAAGTFLVVAGRSSAAGGSDLRKATAFVKKQCPGGQRTISHRMWTAGFAFNALYGNCLAGDGTDQHIWFFDHGHFVGKDARTPSHFIVGLWRNERTLAFMYVLYRRSDPNCCATGGGAVVRFHWSGTRVRRLDPLPQSAATKGVRLGR